MRDSLKLNASPVAGQLVENPSAGVAMGVVDGGDGALQAVGVQVFPPDAPQQTQTGGGGGAIAVVLGRNDDKRLHAEAANRSRTATRPAMGPGHDVGFAPAPGHVTAGFGDPYAKAKDKAIFLEVRKRGLRNPGNLTTYDPQYYKRRKGGSKAARQEMLGTLIRSDKGQLKQSDLPGEADVGGDGMQYVSHSAMVCTGIITVLGLLYTWWYHDRYAEVSTLGPICIFGPALCLGGKVCTEETATRQPRSRPSQSAAAAAAATPQRPAVPAVAVVVPAAGAAAAFETD